MPLPKFTMKEIDDTIGQLIEQTQQMQVAQTQTQKPPPQMLQQLMEKAKAKRSQAVPAPDRDKQFYDNMKGDLMAEIARMLPTKAEESKPKRVHKRVERDKDGRIVGTWEEEA